MIVDAHAHFGIMLGRSFSSKQFVETLDIYGISKSCVSSIEAINYYAETGNNSVLALMEQYPKRIIGFCVPNPYQQPRKEVRRCIKAGFRGIKLHPWGSECSLANYRYTPVFEEAATQDIPVLFHSGGSLKVPDFKYATPEMIFSVAERFPKVKMIIGHMGLERWKEMVERVVDYKNLYLDITMSMPHPDRINIAVQKVGAERVIFGTDMTLLEPAIPLGLIQGSKISDEEKELILGGNIMRLLNMEVENK